MTRRDEIQRLRSAALEGSVDAQYDLACAYAEGDGVPRSKSTAYRWFEKAAGQGDAESMTAAGYCLLNGDGVEEDHEAAVAWFRRAAEAGDPDASRYLASCTLYGEGMSQDVSEGLRLAEHGWNETQDSEYAHLLACAYHDLEHDLERAVEWHRTAAEHGHDESMVWMGYFCRYGIGVERSLKRAFRWYQQAAEAENDAGLANVAICFHNGEGVGQDFGKAFDFRTRAAEKGHVESRMWLAVQLLQGLGVDPEPERALAMLADLAREEPQAALMLGEKHYYGEGVEKDSARAHEWFEVAARQDVPEAWTFLGVCAWNGEGRKADAKDAIECYRRAADLGDSHALYNLGLAYRSGEGVERDLKRADQLFEQAAMQGNGPAACLLARRHIEGDGVPVNPSFGVSFLQAAVDDEDPEDLALMAECFRDGVGVRPDLKRSMELFELAQVQGKDTRVERGIVRRRLHGKP